MTRTSRLKATVAVAAIVAQVQANPGTIAGIHVADQLNTWANPDNGRPAIPPETTLGYLQATGGVFHQQLSGIPVYTDVEDAELTADQPGQASAAYLLGPTSMFRYETHAVVNQLYQSGYVDGFFLADNLLNWDPTAQTRAWQTARSLWPQPFVLVPRAAGLSFPDSVYPFDAAYAERQTTDSNFHIETNISCFEPSTVVK